MDQSTSCAQTTFSALALCGLGCEGSAVQICPSRPEIQPSAFHPSAIGKSLQLRSASSPRLMRGAQRTRNDCERKLHGSRSARQICLFPRNLRTARTLLTFATHAVVPVHIGAVRVVAPRPDVQLEEGRNAIPVGAAHELKSLAFQHRRHSFVACQPCGCIHDVLDTHQLSLVSHWLIDQRFWMLGVDFSVARQLPIDVVNTHGSVVGTADATKCGCIVGTGIVDIEVLLGCGANNLNKLGRGRTMSVANLAQCDKRRNY